MLTDPEGSEAPSAAAAAPPPLAVDTCRDRQPDPEGSEAPSAAAVPAAQATPCGCPDVSPDVVPETAGTAAPFGGCPDSFTDVSLAGSDSLSVAAEVGVSPMATRDALQQSLAELASFMRILDSRAEDDDDDMDSVSVVPSSVPADGRRKDMAQT